MSLLYPCFLTLIIKINLYSYVCIGYILFNISASISNAVCAVLVAQSCLTLCDPTGCSHGDSPGKNTGVGCHALLQGIFPTQEDSLPSELPEKPRFFTSWATWEAHYSISSAFPLFSPLVGTCTMMCTLPNPTSEPGQSYLTPRGFSVDSTVMSIPGTH